MQISLKLQHHRSYIQPWAAIDEETRQLLNTELSFNQVGSEYMAAAMLARLQEKKPEATEHDIWDGTTRLLGAGSFPTGLTERVQRLLVARGYVVTLSDQIPPPTLGYSLQPVSHFEYPLFPEQIAAAEAVTQLRTPRMGVVEAPPRSGKTIVAAEALRRLNRWPVVFLCERLDIAQPPRGAVAKFQQFFGDSVQVGFAFDGQFEPGDLMVITIQTACQALEITLKHKKGDLVEESLDTERKQQVREFLKRAVVVLCDESHHAAAPTYQTVIEACISRYYTIGLSGTPWRDDNLDLVMEGVIGPVIYRITHSQMITRKQLVPASIYLVHLPIKRYPKGTSFPTRKLDYIRQNPIRNQVIVHFVQGMIRAGKSTMILVESTSHLALIDKWLSMGKVPHYCMTASGTFATEPRQRQKVWDDLHEKKIMCLITTLGNEGIDIPSLDAVVMADGGESSTRCIQRMRAMTAWPGKTACYILEFADKAKHFSRHYEERIRQYQLYPPSVFLLKHVTRYQLPTDDQLVAWLRDRSYGPLEDSTVSNLAQKGLEV